MSTLPLAAPVVKVEPDVLPHVRAKGVEAVLQRLLEATPRVFPTLRSLRVCIEPDPEIRDYTFIVFEVRVPIADVPDFIEGFSRWERERAAAYSSPRQEPFVLHLIREEE